MYHAVFPSDHLIRLEQGQPQTKINLSGDYERGWFGITARTTRYGKVLAGGSEPFLDVPLAAKWVTDVELRAKPFGNGVTFALGANNLFDVYPTNIPRGQGIDPVTGLVRNYPSTNYVAPFSNYSPFGFNGRFLYGRIDVSF